MKKIGIITQHRESSDRTFNNLASDYTSAIEKAGVLAIMIPIFSENIASYIELCDGFIFPGGPDIDPSLYGQPCNGAYDIIPEYDQFLCLCMANIHATAKPILGICKGMQLLNIYHDGTLKQHIPEHVFHLQGGRGYEYVDTIDILSSGSWLAEIYKSPSLRVNSIHHQAIDTLGRGFQIVAQSQHDSEIEAIEHESMPYYGVQWHPEYLDDHGEIFRYFISRC